MKPARQRFRHIQSQRSTPEPRDPYAPDKPTKAEQALADLMDPVVDVPSYMPRTEHVYRPNLGVRLVRWALVALLGIGIQFGVIYGALSLHAHQQRQREEQARLTKRLQTLNLLHKELEGNLGRLQTHVDALEGFEKAVRAYQHTEPPALTASFAAPLWERLSTTGELDEPELYRHFDSFYQGVKRLDTAYQAYAQEAADWWEQTEGVSFESLSPRREKTKIARIRRLDDNFAELVQTTHRTLAAYRDDGERLMAKLSAMISSQTPQ